MKRTNSYITDYTKESPAAVIKDMAFLNGMSYPTDEELIMLILKKDFQSAPSRDMATEIMEVISSSGDGDVIKDLTKIHGVGSATALAVAAALELGKRRRGLLNVHIEEPADIVPFLQHYALFPTEHFITVSMNGAREIIGTHTISVGTTDRALIHPREVFAEAVTEHASSIICCHNHPAGKCFPSEADIASTKVLLSAAKVLGITFMDHIIITKSKFYSFLEHGMLD